MVEISPYMFGEHLNRVFNVLGTEQTLDIFRDQFDPLNHVLAGLNLVFLDSPW